MKTLVIPHAVEFMLLTAGRIVAVDGRWLIHCSIGDADCKWKRGSIIARSEDNRRLFSPTWRYAGDTTHYLVLVNSKQYYLIDKNSMKVEEIVSRTLKNRHPVDFAEDKNFTKLVKKYGMPYMRKLVGYRKIASNVDDSHRHAVRGIPDMRFIENVRIFLYDPTQRVNGEPNPLYKNYIPDEMYLYESAVESEKRDVIEVSVPSAIETAPDAPRSLVIKNKGVEKIMPLLPEGDRFVAVAISSDLLTVGGCSIQGQIVIVDVDS